MVLNLDFGDVSLSQRRRKRRGNDRCDTSNERFRHGSGSADEFKTGLVWETLATNFGENVWVIFSAVCLWGRDDFMNRYKGYRSCTRSVSGSFFSVYLAGDNFTRFQLLGSIKCGILSFVCLWRGP